MGLSGQQNQLPPLAIVSGTRTPFVKAFTEFADIPADELGRVVLEDALAQCGLKPQDVDEVVFGQCCRAGGNGQHCPSHRVASRCSS